MVDRDAGSAVFWARVAAAVVEESANPTDDRALVERIADRIDVEPDRVPELVSTAWERQMFEDRRRSGEVRPELTWKARWLLERVGEDAGRS